MASSVIYADSNADVSEEVLAILNQEGSRSVAEMERGQSFIEFGSGELFSHDFSDLIKAPPVSWDVDLMEGLPHVLSASWLADSIYFGTVAAAAVVAASSRFSNSPLRGCPAAVAF